MLHIILAILKILGILLAVILLLLLLIVCIVLFVPIRYKLEAEKTGSFREARGKIGIRWLFGAVTVCAVYEKEKLSAAARILWIKKQIIGEEENRSAEGGQESMQKEKKKTEKIQTEKIQTEETQTEKTQTEKTQTEETQTEKMQEEAKKEEGKAQERVQTKEAEKNEQKDKAEKEEKNSRRKWFFIPDILGFFHKVKTAVINFWKKLLDIKDSFEKKWQHIRRYIELLRSEMTKEVFGILKGHTFYLLRHLRPRKIKGRIHFGMEDPSLTGQITGVLYLLQPMCCCEVALEPDFETQVLEGEIFAAGHMRLCHVAKTGIQIWFDKTLRAYWKRINQLRRN